MKTLRAKVLLYVTLEILLTVPFGSAQARDIWIHAVGIDTHDESQNSDSFYKSGADFIKICKKSARKPECHLLINTDPKLMNGSDLSQLKLTPNEGVATRKKFLKLLEDAVGRVGESDQLILSLQDHGAPSKSLSGNSCVYFDDDFVCDNDISALIKTVKKGVHVFINADACYSGAFSNVVKDGACALTASDQLHTGTGGMPSFWQMINRADANGIEQLKVPTEGGSVHRLSSQMIMRTICKPARNQLQAYEGGLEPLLELGKLRVIRDYDDEIEMAYHFSSIAFALKKVTGTLSAFSCVEAKLPDAVCSATKRILKDKESQEYFYQLDKYFSQFIQLNNQIKSLVEINSTGLDSNVVSALNQIFNWGIDPRTFDDWPSEKLLPIRSFIKTFMPVKLQLTNERSAVRREMLKTLHKSQGLQSYQDWLDVYECLLPDRFDDQDVGPVLGGSAYWDDIARHSQPLDFTEKDYNSARQCESGVKF